METEEILGTVELSSRGVISVKESGEETRFALLVARDGGQHILGLHFVFSLEQAGTFFDRYEADTTFESQEAVRTQLDELDLPVYSEQDAVVADGMIALYLATMLDHATEYMRLQASLALLSLSTSGDDDPPPTPWDPNDPSVN